MYLIRIRSEPPRQLGNFSMSAAVVFYQSIMGLICILLFNGLVRKIDKDSSLLVDKNIRLLHFASSVLTNAIVLKDDEVVYPWEVDSFEAFTENPIA